MAKKKRVKEFNLVRVNKAAARKAHFENGGTTATWRGRAVIFIDKKTKEKSKRWRWEGDGGDE